MTDFSIFRERLLARLATVAGKSAQDAAPPLTEDQVVGLAKYYDLLRHWNRRINLTALPLDGFPDLTLDRLLIEPLIAAYRTAAFQTSANWIDLGSGGGSPALPMKIVCPHVPLTMTESRSRKAAFLRTGASELGLENVSVLNARIEDVSPVQRRFDVATARGLRVDQALADEVTKLLQPAGLLLILISTEQRIPSLPGWELVDAVSLIPRASLLATFQKLATDGMFHVEHSDD